MFNFILLTIAYYENSGSLSTANACNFLLLNLTYDT